MYFKEKQELNLLNEKLPNMKQAQRWARHQGLSRIWASFFDPEFFVREMSKKVELNPKYRFD